MFFGGWSMTIWSEGIRCFVLSQLWMDEGVEKVSTMLTVEPCLVMLDSSNHVPLVNVY